MRRREFITLLGGGAATWPLAARAQERVRLIGVLTSGTIADNPDTQARMAAFLQGLQHLGWADGRNVRIVYRSGLGDADNTHKYAAELAALAPDVILTTGTTTVAPMLQATRTVPIVFVAVADPVGAGFVDSLSRPGGNATGFMQFEYSLSGKWLELLKQIAPGMTRAAVLRDRPDRRDRPIRRNPVSGAVDRGGGKPDQRTRRRRDRTSRHGLRALLEWWSDRDWERANIRSSQSDHHAGGPAQAARGVLATNLRHRWRPNLLWV